MNFVIFSYNFLPQNDAEAFCTARFANALAEEGHDVHVVTVAHPNQVSDEIVNELIPSVKKITRIEVKQKTRSVWARIKYQTPEWDSVNYDKCICELRKVLHQYDKPILVSRMCPDASGIIAWHCRKDAALWVNHFSDPFPNYLKGGLLGNIMNRFTFRWARRFLKDSAFCTITCPDVIRFFRERVTPVEDERFVLVPHIGEPLIQPDEKWKSPTGDKPFIAHAGNCYDGRYASELVRELLLCRKAGLDLAFVQAGAILDRDSEQLSCNNIDFHKIALNNPREASSIFMAATVNLVIDLKIDYGGYTPFIPSKFVYLLYTDKPIVVFARKDSWMYRLTMDNPDAGIFFADVNEDGALAKTIQKIYENKDAMSFNRSALQNFFSKKACVKEFIARCANS